MAKIRMAVPIVEMDGDEMTRVLWQWIKEILLEPYIDLNTEYYDLGLPHRDEVDDAVTRESAEAAKRLGVAVKCATITPNEQRKEEYNLKALYASPNATIRAMLDGTVFRAPIVVRGITPFIPAWKKPVIIARHAYGDIYKSAETRTEAGDTCELVVSRGGKEVQRLPVHTFGEGGGVVMGMHNVDASIEAFAHSCLTYALDTKMNVLFAAKDTISKVYDGRFKEIFAKVFEKDYRKRFEKAGIEYDYALIDDAVARVVRGEGGLIWACKNYDGDVMSDMVATVFGSLAMMTSVLVSPGGVYEFEAAHGTVTRHYYRYLKGEETSTNPVATIFAWTGALSKRGELDNNAELCAFSKKLEEATLAVIERGIITKDLLSMFKLPGVTPRGVNTKEFLLEIAKSLG